MQDMIKLKANNQVLTILKLFPRYYILSEFPKTPHLLSWQKLCTYVPKQFCI